MKAICLKCRVSLWFNGEVWICPECEAVIRPEKLIQENEQSE